MHKSILTNAIAPKIQSNEIMIAQMPAVQGPGGRYQNRVINFFADFDDAKCNEVVEQLLQWEEEDAIILYNHSLQAKQLEDPSQLLKPIILNINSYGGSVDGLLAIVDMLYTLDAPVITRALGTICSCGFILFCAGDQRIVGPNCSLMYHSLAYMCGGKFENVDNYTKYSKKVQKRLDKIVHDNTGITYKVLANWRANGLDKWMDAKEALALNIATDKLY